MRIRSSAMTVAALITVTPMYAAESSDSTHSMNQATRIVPTPVRTRLNRSMADDEWVTAVVEVKHVPASSFVPILRPLLPQNAHLVAHSASNQLVVVASVANARRISELVKVMDRASPFQPSARVSPQVPEPVEQK